MIDEDDVRGEAEVVIEPLDETPAVPAADYAALRNLMAMPGRLGDDAAAALSAHVRLLRLKSERLLRREERLLNQHESAAGTPRP